MHDKLLHSLPKQGLLKFSDELCQLRKIFHIARRWLARHGPLHANAPTIFVGQHPVRLRALTWERSGNGVNHP